MTTTKTTTKTTTPVPTQTNWFQTINASYQNQKSHYVNVTERFDYYAGLDPASAASISRSVTAFFSQYTKLKSWQDMDLCTAVLVPMQDIVIDTTLQRNLDLSWVLKIFQKFRPTAVDAIKVYTDANQPQHIRTCWDGQHTLILLYILAVYVFKIDPSTIMVPCVINKSTSKEEMRLNFITHNDDGKSPLSNVELHRQKVLGVRIDKSMIPEWIMHAQIQDCLEEANLFLCEPNSREIRYPGAISNMSEIEQTVNGSFLLQDWSNFCQFFNKICNSSRSVDSSEMWQIMYYFRAARTDKIDVDDTYIDMFVEKMLDIWGPKYTGSRMLEKGKSAYLNWFLSHSPYGTTQGNSWHSNRMKDLHTTYLIKLLRNNQPKFPVPAPSLNRGLWEPPTHFLEKSYCQA